MEREARNGYWAANIENHLPEWQFKRFSCKETYLRYRYDFRESCFKIVGHGKPSWCRAVGWSDTCLALLSDFRIRLRRCRSCLFLWVQFQVFILKNHRDLKNYYFLEKFTYTFILLQRTIANKKIWNSVWFNIFFLVFCTRENYFFF